MTNDRNERAIIFRASLQESRGRAIKTAQMLGGEEGATEAYSEYAAGSPRRANGRVEDWRGTRERARLQPPPPQTARTDFPYAASLAAWRQGLCDLSAGERFQALARYCTR